MSREGMGWLRKAAPWWKRRREGALGTDMHVHHLAITFHAIDNCRNEYKSVLARKVADAALVLVIVASMGRKVEFKGRGKSGERCQ